MSSSTSNSKPTFSHTNRVWYSLATFLLVAFLYQVLITLGFIRPTLGRTLREKNLIQAQQYVFEESEKPDMVLVGSSLSTNLGQTLAPEKLSFVNLGMSGGSTQTGLEIVRQAQPRPSILLVEINGTITRGADDALLSILFTPYWRTACSRFSMLRQEFQPSGVISDLLISLRFSWIMGKFQGLKYRLVSAIAYIMSRISLTTHARVPITKKSTATINSAQSDLTNLLIQQQVETNKQVLPAEKIVEIRMQADYIRRMLLEIQAQEKDVEIFLLHIPREHAVDESAQSQQVWRLLREEFPSGKFKWLPSPPKKHWKTYDGIHLTPAEARAFAAFVKDQLSELSLIMRTGKGRCSSPFRTKVNEKEQKPKIQSLVKAKT